VTTTVLTSTLASIVAGAKGERSRTAIEPTPPHDMTNLYLALAALALLLAAWLFVRAALRGLRTFVRSLWPH
jgi:hypothetical protein